MVKCRIKMNAVFHALAHDARREMLHRLASKDLTVGELAAPLSMSLPAASKHIIVLQRAGLIRRTISGRNHLCSLEPGPLASVSSWLQFYERFWNERLDALVDLMQPTPKKRDPK
jgi:DNA-binding transcriptional ArsR family regulator